MGHSFGRVFRTQRTVSSRVDVPADIGKYLRMPMGKSEEHTASTVQALPYRALQGLLSPVCQRILPEALRAESPTYSSQNRQGDAGLLLIKSAKVLRRLHTFEIFDC